MRSLWPILGATLDASIVSDVVVPLPHGWVEIAGDFTGTVRISPDGNTFFDVAPGEFFPPTPYSTLYVSVVGDGAGTVRFRVWDERAAAVRSNTTRAGSASSGASGAVQVAAPEILWGSGKTAVIGDEETTVNLPAGTWRITALGTDAVAGPATGMRETVFAAGVAYDVKVTNVAGLDLYVITGATGGSGTLYAVQVNA